MNIGLDLMGGDHAPVEAIRGLREYVQKGGNGTLVLFGPEELIKETLIAEGMDPLAFRIVDAPEVIEMHEHPTKALREKQRSSIAVGFGALAKGKIDAFISAGNTGAMLVGALYSIKAIEGVIRPTIGAYMPRENGHLGLLLDAGINADCKPEHLNQFAILGSLYVQHIMGVDSPRVGLLNIGEEEGKGNILAQAVYPLLKENNQIHFIGNLEGRDVFLDKADVIVCEGFTGNVLLKMAESVYDIVKRRDIHDEYFDRFNFEMYGGVPVLGVSKPVIIGHGISHAKAFYNMIELSRRMIEKDLLGKIEKAFQA
jgi:phosphate acyltransferase